MEGESSQIIVTTVVPNRFARCSTISRMIYSILLIAMLLASTLCGAESKRLEYSETEWTTLPSLIQRPAIQPHSVNIPDAAARSQILHASAESSQDINDIINTTDVPALGTETGKELLVSIPVTEEPSALPLTNQSNTTEVQTTEDPFATTFGNESTEAPTTQAPTVHSLMTFIIRDSGVLCQRIRNIDSYETTVLGSLPPRRSLEYKRLYNAYSVPYNETLETVRAHMAVWRKGNDIVTGMRSIYKLAREYEEEFERKSLIYKEQIKSVPYTSEMRVLKLTGDIQGLKRDIEKYKRDLHAVPEEVKVYLQSQLSEYEAKLTEKLGELERSTHFGIRLEELVTFAGFVRNDAIKIKEKATVTSQKLADLVTNVMEDNQTISQYIVNATEDVLALNEKDITEQERLDEINNRIANLKEEERNLQSLKNDMNSAIDLIRQNKEVVRAERKEKEELYEEKKKVICKGKLYQFYVDENNRTSVISCDDYMKKLGHTREIDAINTQNRRLKNLNENLTTLVNNKTIVLSKINEKNQVISSTESSASQHRTALSQIQAELQDFNMYMTDMLTLRGAIEHALPFIEETEHGLQQVAATFDLIIQDLGMIISRGTARYKDEERAEAIASMENGLEALQDHMVGSSLKIANIERCSMLALAPLQGHVTV